MIQEILNKFRAAVQTVADLYNYGDIDHMSDHQRMHVRECIEEMLDAFVPAEIEIDV